MSGQSSSSDSSQNSSSSSLGVEDPYNSQVLFPDPATLCSYGPRPFLLTGLLVQLLRQHFASPEGAGVEDATLRDRVWRPDETTKIIINSATKWDPTVAMSRPAILVRRNDVQVARQGINDELMGASDISGIPAYSTLLIGSHTLFVVDNEAGGAEYLAAEVARDLIQFGPEIRKRFYLMRFLILGIGELMLVEEAAGSWVIPVTVAWAAQETWKLIQHVPLLKTLNATILEKIAAEAG